MEFPMRKVMLSLAVATAMFFALPTVGASAVSWPTLTCNIQPNSNDVFHPIQCGTTKVASSYTVDYFAQGGSGVFTYAWTPPSGWPIVGGCTSTSDFCIISTNARGTDRTLPATVVIHQGSSSNTQTVTAFLNAVCGTMLC